MVDISGDLGYNEATLNDDNAFVVKLDEQAPLNDTECKHESLVPDPDDTIGEAVYHGCANKRCGLGFYIRQS